MTLPLRRWLLPLVLALISCGTATFVVQQYEGAPRDEQRIAILRVNGGTQVVVVALDGEELNYSETDENSRVHIEMLPGDHQVDVGNLSDPLQRVVSVEFRAQPGKVYRLVIDGAGQAELRPWRPLVWEVDRDSDRALAVAASPSSERVANVRGSTGASPPESSHGGVPSAPTVPRQHAVPEPSGTAAPDPAAKPLGSSAVASPSGGPTVSPATVSPTPP